jgi:hypothetical protein
MHSRTNHPTGTPRQSGHGWWRITWSVAAVAAIWLALATPLPVQAKTFHCGAGDVACLIAAINEANANGTKNTIRLEAGTYTLTAIDNNTDGPNGLPSITSPLTIQGAGADTTILERDSSAPGFRLVHVAASGNVRLTEVTLTGGGGVGVQLIDGGGLFNNGGTVHLVRTVVTGNGRGFRSGGGLFNNGGRMRLVHTTITGNLPSLDGGGLFNNGGVVTIRQSAFAQNGGSPGTGGGLFNNTGGLMTIADTTFSGNSAGGGGGGLANRGSTVSITKTTFIRNHALGPGGGLQNGGGGTVTITNTAFVQNGSQDLGGGLANLGGTVTITNTTIAQNGAFAGGGIYGPGMGTTITNSTISGNSGSPDGFGGIFGGVLQNTILAGNTWNKPGVGTVPCDGSGTSLGNNLIGDPTGCTFPIILQPTDLTGDPGLDIFTDNGTPGNGHFPLLPTS